MPNQRPVSPVALEPCCPPPESDHDLHGLLGSDDELDDVSRAAKYQRIERLAEAYLQGRPMFISSAALRGPFDEGWKNPWRKKRKVTTKSDTKLSVAESGGRDKTHGTTVRKTDVRKKRYKTDLEVHSRPHTVSASPFVQELAPAFNIENRASPSPYRSGQKRPSGIARAEEISRVSPQLPKRLKEEPQSTDNPTLAEQSSADWLKKGRRRMKLKSFEPPSSPTPKSGHRSEIGSRGSASRSVAPKSPSSSDLATAQKATLSARLRTNIAANVSPHATRSPAQAPQQSPNTIAAVPSPCETASENCAKGSSLRVISSTSQLARFEYRLRVPVSSPQSEPNSTAEEFIAANPSTQADEKIDADAPEPVHQLRPKEPPNTGHGTDQPVQLSKSLRFVNDTDGATSTSTYIPTATEQNTYDELPSAQQVPVLPGVSDRVPSLYSTIMSKENANIHKDTSPDTQLSTQAAFLHAQKSFQDDLESPAHGYGITPAQPRAMTNAGDESLLAQETPLYRPGTLERALPHGLKLSETKHSDKSKIQAMSTQCMIDAATPFTFSTEKKIRSFRSLSPPKTSPSKTRPIHMAETISPLASSPVSVFDPDSFAAQPEPKSPHSPSPYAPPENTIAYPYTTDATLLPLDLGGSTPTTQDGQGGLHTTDSFNLNQAIADAGSWLRQSFK
ncbi:hypothetical protein N7520_007461 [Penicillium odoratum]|uniref:uncharacterized protein n=1 Tax=Penicillium odoratum TaxID=1167516 RepID=UPI002548A6DD|nr:uncharacterized protein N7520_007461 [Penicillium odoratum]KAJ5760305.1 hypothetical protein N7520_007461 [Penicillium odoratum]